MKWALALRSGIELQVAPDRFVRCADKSRSVGHSRCKRSAVVESGIIDDQPVPPKVPSLLTVTLVANLSAAGFEVLPKRWIVERTFAWISRNRRLARDFERYATTVAAFIRLAMIRMQVTCANASP